MPSRSFRLLTLGSIFASLALSAPAYAQAPVTAAPPATTAGAPASGGPATAVTPSAGSGHRASVAAPSGQEEARVDQRITELHKRLQITPQQEDTWKSFAQVMRDNARDMDSEYESRASQLASLNAVDNMQSYAKITEQHAQNVQRLIGPFTTLYQMMSPDQQRTADQVFRNYAEKREHTAKRS